MKDLFKIYDNNNSFLDILQESSKFFIKCLKFIWFFIVIMFFLFNIVLLCKWANEHTEFFKFFFDINTIISLFWLIFYINFFIFVFLIPGTIFSIFALKYLLFNWWYNRKKMDKFLNSFIEKFVFVKLCIVSLVIIWLIYSYFFSRLSLSLVPLIHDGQFNLKQPSSVELDKFLENLSLNFFNIFVNSNSELENYPSLSWIQNGSYFLFPRFSIFKKNFIIYWLYLSNLISYIFDFCYKYIKLKVLGKFFFDSIWRDYLVPNLWNLYFILSKYNLNFKLLENWLYFIETRSMGCIYWRVDLEKEFLYVYTIEHFTFMNLIHDNLIMSIKRLLPRLEEFEWGYILEGLFRNFFLKWIPDSWLNNFQLWLNNNIHPGFRVRHVFYIPIFFYFFILKIIIVNKWFYWDFNILICDYKKYKNFNFFFFLGLLIFRHFIFLFGIIVYNFNLFIIWLSPIQIILWISVLISFLSLKVTISWFLKYLK